MKASLLNSKTNPGSGLVAWSKCHGTITVHHPSAMGDGTIIVMERTGVLSDAACLDLSGCTGLSDITTAVLAESAGIKVLRLVGCSGLGRRSWRRIGQMRELVELDVSECHLPVDEALHHLAQAPRLRCLALRRTSVSLEGLLSEAYPRNLLWLDLRGCENIRSIDRQLILNHFALPDTDLLSD